MRTKLFFTTAMLLFSIVCLSQNNMPLVGTWKLISGKAVINDTTSNYGAPNDESMKIVTPTHFSIMSKNASDGTLQVAFMGRVKMDATNYTEYLDFASVKSMTSKISSFTYKIEGNKWYIKGGMENMKFDEVWQRVE